MGHLVETLLASLNTKCSGIFQVTGDIFMISFNQYTFTNRYYTPNLVCKQICSTISPHTLHSPSTPKNQLQKNSSLITQYHLGLELNPILLQGFYFLSSYPKMRNIMPNIISTPKEVFHHPSNFHDILAHSYVTLCKTDIPKLLNALT